MKTKEELLSSRGYWIANIQLDLFKQVDEYMKVNNLNRTQLAEKLGFTKGYISQVLNGEFNHRIATLVDLSLAIGKVPKIEFEDLSKLIQNENEGFVKKTWQIYINNGEMSQATASTNNKQPVIVPDFYPADSRKFNYAKP
jgi:transcriptional regulator with XRE-family HTH domain